MLKALFTWFSLFLCTLGYSWSAKNPALAQVTSDGTVNTEVKTDGNTAEITGGETRGDNLFHSFQDFSVETGNEASFDNADRISNIFSRVTGGNISNIDGLISANGSANLFLINPAGIVFGEGARLDVGGSFYASSASSILFEDGEFSAADLKNPPLLTVNAPIGLRFRDQPGDIVNRSIGLEVLPGNNLALIGGNLNFEAGRATANGGNIQLGGLSQAGTVSINGDSSFSFPEAISKADITLSNGADVDTTGTGGGNITFNARNLSLTAEKSDSSSIRVGIRKESTAAEAQAGMINIDIAGKLTLDDSRIFNQVAPGGVGNSGNITIKIGSLEAINGGVVDASTFGQGNAGRVDITATGDITFSGENSLGLVSGATSQVNVGAIGNAGGVTISTNNLNLTAGGQVGASTFAQGDAGRVDITATGDITAEGEDLIGFPSTLASQVNVGAVGNAGGVTVSTNNLNLTAGGRVDASTFAQGDAGRVDVTATGDIIANGENSTGFPSTITSEVNQNAVGNAGGVTISGNNLHLTAGGVVDASTFGEGDAGKVNINTTGDIIANGENSTGFPSGVTSEVNIGAVGDAGGVTISTNNLHLTAGGRVEASTLGQGNAGKVNINTTGDITADGENSIGIPSGVTSLVDTGAVGNAGGVTISTNNLNLTAGGRVNASTFSQGNAANITIDATESIFISGAMERFRSGVSANALNKDGNGGNVNISTDRLTITDSGAIEATNFENIGEDDIPGTGQPGIITISANSLDLASAARIEAATQSVTGGGIINLNIKKYITLSDNSFISAQAFGEANGGDLSIDSKFIIAYPSNGIGNDLVATADTGKGGSIDLNVEQLFGLQSGNAIDSNNNSIVNNSNDLDASSNVFGFDGTVEINTSRINPIQGATELPRNVVKPEQTTAQTCSANREGKANNGLAIAGKGGITPAPDAPLNSENIMSSGQSPATDNIPQAIETSQGKIQPARGVRVTESGKIVLTAYRTNSAGERIPEIKPNCKSY